MTNSQQIGQLLGQWQRRYAHALDACMDKYNGGELTQAEYHMEMTLLKDKYDPTITRLCQRLVAIEHAQITKVVQAKG